MALSQKRKIVAISLFITIAIIFIGNIEFANAWSIGDPLVPKCNLTVKTGDAISGISNPCTFCNFLELVQNVLNYTWWVITPIVLTLMLMWGGGLMFFGSMSGNTSNIEAGKKKITHTLVGIALVFASWLIIDTVIKVLGGKTAAGSAITDGFGPWNKLNCNSPAATTAPVGIVPPADPTFSPTAPQTIASSAICRSILGNSRINLNEPGECRSLLSGESVNVQTNIRECAESKPPTVCQAGCRNQSVCRIQSGITLNARMLAAIDSVGQTTSFRVTSIATGAHSSVSNHYAGNAVDVIPPTRTVAEFESLRQKFQNAGGTALCEASSGETYQNCTTSFPSNKQINHIHINF